MPAHVRVRISAVLVFLFIAGSFLLPFTAAQAAMVSYSEGSNLVTVLDSTGVANISALYDALVNVYGADYVNAHVLTEVSDKVWLSKASIKVPSPGNFLVSDHDVTELRVGKGGQNNGWALDGYIAFNNVRVAGWNVAEDRYSNYDDGGRCTLYSEAHNTEFYGFYAVIFGYLYGQSIKNLSYSNLTIDHTRSGLIFQKADHITVDNVTIKDGDRMFGGGIMSSQMNNSTLSNIRIVNVSDKVLGATGAYGFQLEGDNNTIYNVYIESVSYSGVLLGGNHVNVTSMTVIDAGHNGFEINAGARDIYLKDITVKNSKFINFFQVGRSEAGTTTGNITWDNLRSETPGGHAIVITEGSFDTLVKNSTFLGHPASASNSRNVTFLNCLSDGVDAGTDDLWGFVTYLVSSAQYPAFNYNENHKFIDCRAQNIYFRHFGFQDTKNVRVINVDSSPVYLLKSDYSRYYYVDVQVVDSTGTPVANAVITIANETNPAFTSVNGWGNDQRGFVTGADGHVPLPNADRAGSPAIAEFHATTSTVDHFTYCITAESGGLIASAIGVAPDATWYRTDPDVSTNTIIIRLPARSAGDGTGLSFLSPKAGADVSERTTVELSTASLAMTRADIYIDNTLAVVLTTAPFSWEWDPANVTAGEHTIKAVGYDGSGNGYYAEVTVRVVRSPGGIVPPDTYGMGERVYPNPYIKGKSGGNGKITISNLPASSIIRIFTIAGEPVTTIRHDQGSEGGSEEWDASKFPGGIYLYTIQTAQAVRKGKIGVVK